MRCNQKPFVTNDEDNITDKGSSGSTDCWLVSFAAGLSYAKLPVPTGMGSVAWLLTDPSLNFRRQLELSMCSHCPKGSAKNCPVQKQEEDFFYLISFSHRFFMFFGVRKLPSPRLRGMPTIGYYVIFCETPLKDQPITNHQRSNNLACSKITSYLRVDYPSLSQITELQ